MKKALGAAALLAVCFGCSPASRYYGEWQTSVPVATVTATGTTVFSSDGTFTMNLSGSTALGSATMKDSGRWAMEGDKIKMTLTSQNWDVSVGNPAAKALVLGIVNKAKQDVKDAFDKAGPMEASWTGSGAFTLTPGSTAFTFSRKKG